MTIAKYEINSEHNGIELYFESKPTQKIIDTLKSNKWRWHRVKKCWYAKHSDVAEKTAQAIVNGETLPKECAAMLPVSTKSTKVEYFKNLYDYISIDEYRKKLIEYYDGSRYTAFDSVEDAVNYFLNERYGRPGEISRYVREAIVWKSLSPENNAFNFNCNADNANYYTIWDKLPVIEGLKPGKSYSATWGYEQTQITTATHYGRAFGLDVLVLGGFSTRGEILLKRISKDGRFNDGVRYFSPCEYTGEHIDKINEHALYCGR